MKIAQYIMFIIAGLVLQALQALVLVQYWQWFIITTFDNAPSLNFLQALALTIVGSLIWGQDKPSRKSEVILIEGTVKIILLFVVGFMLYVVFFTGLFS